MGLPIVGGISGVIADVQAASKALHVLLYAADGTPLAVRDRGAVIPGTTESMPILGRDGPVGRMLRVSSNGSMRGGDDTPLFFDSCEGTAVDTNKWIQTLTTMTITQALAIGMLFNAGSSVAANVGALQTTQSRFADIARNGLVFRCRAQPGAHFNNNLHEMGFGAPSTAIVASIGDGACWRKDGSGQWVPVLTFNGGTDVLGTPISDATFRAAVPVGDYAIFEVFLEDTRATFRILTTDSTIVNEQIVYYGGTVGTFGVTRLQAFLRNYNAGVVATAVQLRVAEAAVWLTDAVGPLPEQLAVWNNNGSLTSPTVYTQLANYAQGVAPVAAVLSTSAPSYATLGGQWSFATIAGVETDNALFGFLVPVPFGLTVTRVAIDAVNTGAAVATTANVIQWGLAFGSSGASLATAAPYAPMRKAIGYHSWPVGAGVGASGGPAVVWAGREKVQPGRYFHVIMKQLIGTPTGSQLIRGTCVVDGYFE